MTTAGVSAALQTISSHESPFPREMRTWLESILPSEPWPYVMGPLMDRGAPSGLVWIGGTEVARCGDPDRLEPVCSIAKSAMSTVAGLAVDDGLLTDLDEPVVEKVPLTAFGGDTYGPGVPANPEAARQITWRHLLSQTSEWRGTLFDVPWWADPQGDQERSAAEAAPGTHFSYNDIRTTLCSLALTHLHGESNETTLRTRVLEPLGERPEWSWRGLYQTHTRLAGSEDPVEVMSGGSHWGGGLSMSAEGLARYGQLHLDGGVWKGARLLGEEWCREMLRPTPAHPPYGLMWWRNPEAGVPIGEAGASPLGEIADQDARYPGAGVRGFGAFGTGAQIVWCDPDRDLVAVVRWVDDLAPVLAAITAAVPAVGADRSSHS